MPEYTCPKCYNSFYKKNDPGRVTCFKCQTSWKTSDYEEDYSLNEPDIDYLKIGLVGAIIGFFIGGYYGFILHGIGGAILGLFIGAIAGGILLLIALYFLALSIGIGILAGIIWLFLQLWDLGKP